jgi:hypothetical protein
MTTEEMIAKIREDLAEHEWEYSEAGAALLAVVDDCEEVLLSSGVVSPIGPLHGAGMSQGERAAATRHISIIARALGIGGE